MAGYSARQSTYVDGDVIDAADSNDEFDQILAAFNNSSGHKHDGTAGEGAVIGLIGDPGETAPLNKVVIDNPNNQIEFSVDVSSSSVEQLVIKDGVIEPTTNNDIDLGSSSKQFKDLYIDGTAYVDAINFNGIAITATAAELNIMDGVTSTAAELNILDGVTSTAAEINIIDGNTSATSTTLADADRVVVNDNGTMVQVALTDFETYFEGALDTLSNVTTVGALNSGSITSGFGNINNGSSTITTTGLITGGSLDIDDVVINGSTIGHTDDTDLITVANGIATVAGELSVTTLDIGGTNVTSTAAEINILDGDTSATSTTLADGDRLIVNDGGTMKQVALTDFETYFESVIDTLDTSVFTSQTAETSVASDDLVLIFDASASAFRKMTRANFTAGLATSSAISNLSEDSTPQLGGNLDTNSHNILIDDAHFIADESGNEQIIFQTTGSAVNQFDITNAASGSGPTLSSTGDDTNVDLNLVPKGSGVVQIDGSNGVAIQSGSISIKNSGAQSYVDFYCESSNAHYARLQAPAHSAFSGNITLTMPATTDTLVGRTTTDTLTNKTLTSPTISAPAVTGTATFGGASGVSISQGAISIKNGGTQSYVDFYCESSNAHYARLQAPAHASFSGNITLTLPATTDTLAGIAATQTLTNKTLTSPTINGGSLNSVTASTQSAGTNDTTIATTAFAQTAASNEAVALAIALG